MSTVDVPTNGEGMLWDENNSSIINITNITNSNITNSKIINFNIINTINLLMPRHVCKTSVCM